MPKIDCHTYLAGTPFSEDMVSKQSIVATMQQFDLEAVVLVSNFGTDCDLINGNKQLRQIVNVSDGIYGYVTVNSEYPEQSIEQQRTFLTKREFVGTVFAPPFGRAIALDDVREIANAQRRYGKPLAFRARHADDVVGVRAIAEAFPTIPFVLLGMGGDSWRSAVDAARKCVNIHLDISGSRDADKISYAYSVLAGRRMLFGSGLPFAEPTLFEVLVAESKVLTAYDRERILRQNASVLFHINE